MNAEHVDKLAIVDKTGKLASSVQHVRHGFRINRKESNGQFQACASVVEFIGAALAIGWIVGYALGVNHKR